MNTAVVLAVGFGFAASALFLLQQSSKEHRHLRRSVPLSAAAIAVVLAAASSRPHSTGWALADIVLAAAFAGLVALAAVRARRNALLGSTLILTIGALLGSSQSTSTALASAALAGIPFGAALAMRLYPQRERFLQAAVAPLVALSTLNLPTSLPTRIPSVVAGVAAVTLAASAYKATNRRTRKTMRRVGLASVLVTGAFSLFGALALSNARSYAEQAVTSARTGLRSAEELKSDVAVRDLERAAGNLREARASIDAPWAIPARAIPVLGRNIAAVNDIAATVGGLASESSRVVNASNVSRFRPVNGAIDTKALVALRTDVEKIRKPLSDARVVQRRVVTDPWIVSPLSSRLASFSPQLTKLDGDLGSLNNALTYIPPILGDGGNRRYLLVVVTPAEARGSGGVMGNFGELTAVDGKLSLTRFGRSAELSTNGLPLQRRFLDAPADYIARYAAFGANTLWSNMTMGPDFRAVGMAMANHYPQSGGQKVDGVISVDPIALQALLKILGPIDVAGWPEPLDGTNTAEILLFKAYVDKGGASQSRLDLLAQVATGVWGKVSNSALPGPETLGAELGPVARARHLQVWMRNESEQAYMASLRVTGAVPDIGGDNFGLVVNNASANKIEWFLHREIRYAPEIDFATGQVSATATVTLRNDAPPEGLPDYVIGNSVSDIEVPPGDSRLYVSMYSPLDLAEVTLNGKSIENDVQQELGRNVYSSWIVVPSGKTLTLVYKVNGVIPFPGGRYRLDLWSQPLVRPDTASVAVTAKGGSTLVVSLPNGTEVAKPVEIVGSSQFFASQPVTSTRS
jgi:hypothetical protein